MTTHEEQQKAWEGEHARPHVLHQMDSVEPSSGVVEFAKFLQKNGVARGKGIEMGCGKGRNVIWLAGEGYEMYGLDFSANAIAEAKRRGESAGTSATFVQHDATVRWPYGGGEFDIAIDCFASTDIESREGRAFAVSEMYRILKPGGYLLSYVLSTDDEFHKEMILKSPADEKNAFVHPGGKFEKTFDADEVDDLYGSFEKVVQRRIDKTAEFHGKPYACLHFWTVFRKPLH